jgi:hypothetical protein
MSFLTPLYLGALALASIPILIHLIRRRKIRIIQWAAWDFLLQAKRKNRRRLRLEQLLLLLIRMSLICLVVIALSRPVIKVTGLPLISTDTRVHALIVLDNSFSMGYRNGSQNDFARAKQIADSLLAKVLKPGDSVSLVFASAHPEAAIKEPSFSLGSAREIVRTVRVSDYATDYVATATLCTKLLKDVRSPTREIYWITDNQKSGFGEAQTEQAKRLWKSLASAGRLTWINVADQERENVSLEPPSFNRELITPRSPVRIETTVHNYGRSPRHDVQLNLSIDGKPAGLARVDVPPGGKTAAQFTHLFEKSGTHAGSIQIAQPDKLQRDDTVHFAVRVREKLKVLIVDSRPTSDPAHDEAYYIATALSPSGSSGESKTAIDPVVHSGTNLGGIGLRDYDAVVIAGAEDLSSPDRHSLEEYVASGGGLLIFPGPAANSARLNYAFGSTASGPSPGQSKTTLLPALIGPRKLLQDESAVSLNPTSIDSPALASFRASGEIEIGSGKYSTVFDLLPVGGSDSVRIMCRFTGGQPAFVERKYGQGRVILSASTAGTSGNNLPLKPAYVPIAHQLVSYIAAGPASQHNLRVGDPLTARFEVKESGKPIRFTPPEGSTAIRKSALTAQGVIFNYPILSRAGVYRVSTSDSATLQMFAANLPSNESDLQTIPDGELKAALGNAPFQLANSGSGLEALVRRSRRGSEVWRSLVFCALFLLFLEGLLAQRFGRRG